MIGFETTLPLVDFEDLLCVPLKNGPHQKGMEFGKGHKIVRMVDLYRGDHINPEKLDKVTYPKLPSSEFKLKDGDILLNRTSLKREGIAKAVLVRNLSEDTYFDCSIIRARPNKKKVHSEYLNYVLASPYLRLQIMSFAKTATITTMAQPEIKKLKIPLPTIDEQKRIVAILDKTDGIRKKRTTAITLLDNFLRATFNNIVGPGNPKYNEWDESFLADLSTKEKGSMRTGPFGSDLKHSEFVKDGIAVLGIDNAVQNRFAWKERRFISEEKYNGLKRYTVKPNDVLVTIMGTTGRSAVVPDNIQTAITTKHLATITVDQNKCTPFFLAHAIQMHPHLLGQIRQANKGAVMDGLNLGIIKALKLHLPPIEIQRTYSSNVEAQEKLRIKLKDDLFEIKSLFSSLSQRAFKGEL